MKFKNENVHEMAKELFDTILKANSAEDVESLFEDLLTYNEVERLAQRVRAARLLLEGKTYQQIIEETDISSATLSRVSRCVVYGNGYRRFIGGDQ